MELLVFGFESFGTEPVNPSAVAARALDGTISHGVHLRSSVLPVSYERSWAALESALTPKPAAVLGVGQGGWRFSVETRAANHIGGKPDNEGHAVAGPIREGAGDLDVEADTRAMRLAVRGAMKALMLPVPCVLSSDAGGYLCNHTLYRLLEWSARSLPCAFLHVPRLGVVSQEVIDLAVRAAAGALAAGLSSRAPSAPLRA